MRIFAVSDLHADLRANREALERAPLDGHRGDALIVAGDVADREEVLRDVLGRLAERFREVFFVPGNHELWVRGEARDSMEKFRAVLDLCASLGVRTGPARAGDAWVVPLFSWYHRDFDVRGEGVEEELEAWSDHYFCRWPAGLGRPDEAFLALNRPRVHLYDAPVVTFSHFLPRPELLPEVRHLRFRGLPLVTGSLGLERQLREAGSRVHVFGHTHIPWDREIDGVRYLHHPFGTRGPLLRLVRPSPPPEPEAPRFC
jgi:predicted phosphodiesterase